MLGSYNVCQSDGWKIAPHCCWTQRKTLPSLLPPGSAIRGWGHGLRSQISAGSQFCHILAESRYNPYLQGCTFKANEITNAHPVFSPGTAHLALRTFPH